MICKNTQEIFVATHSGLLCGFCIIREKAIRRATFNRTHFRTHFYFRPPKYSIFKHKKRKQNACNLNEISIAATIIRGSNPSPATIKPPYFNRNTVVFLTFRIILQFHKTCFDPILTPIGCLQDNFIFRDWFSLFQCDQQADNISRLVHQVFQYIQFGLIVVLCIAVHEITVCLQQCFKI